MKKISILSLIILLMSCTGLRLALVPSEIEQYCRKISGTVEGINQTMESCIKYELDAKKELSIMAVPDDIERYCGHLSGSTGGSYQVMLTCVNQKMQAL
jgi:hypothetical protein